MSTLTYVIQDIRRSSRGLHFSIPLIFLLLDILSLAIVLVLKQDSTIMQFATATFVLTTIGLVMVSIIVIQCIDQSGDDGNWENNALGEHICK